MTVIQGHGMGAPKPQRQFNYPEGGNRICPMCRKSMTEGNGGTELHLQLDSAEECHPFWLSVGIKPDGTLVVLDARFL